MRFFLFILLLLLLVSCKDTSKSSKILYTVQSDSALFYYQQGWVEIMDYGQYGQAELSYRKSLSFDPNFLIGKSVLARLTLDLKERKRLYTELESQKVSITGDERLILDVYLLLTHYTNLRDQKLPGADEALTQAIQTANRNLQLIAHKYPDEVYLKAEYIEFINSKYDAEHALDSIDHLFKGKQLNNPFILGYQATLQAEMKQFPKALQNAKKLDSLLANFQIPKPDAILADIYFQMGEFKNAKHHADRAVKIDPRNLDASRLKTKIDFAIDSINLSEKNKLL